MEKNKLIGKKVKITSDNSSYDEYREVELKIIKAEVGGYFYDMSIYPQALCELETPEGHSLPFALYEYEFEIQ